MEVVHFQCPICASFFQAMGKAEGHLKKHNFKNGITREDLKLKRITFKGCYIPIVKNQIDPTFLNQYEKVVSGETLNDDKQSNNNVFEGGGRLQRKARFKATQKIREVISGLKEMPEELDVNEEAWLESDEEDEDDFPELILTNKTSKKRGRKLRKIIDIGEETIATPEKGGDCEFCGKSFHLMRPLHKHVLEKHKKQITMILCPVKDCKYKTYKYLLLRQHLPFHFIAEKNELHPELAKEWVGKRRKKFQDFFTCKICLTSCKSLNNLKKHLETHEELVCPYCPAGNEKSKSFSKSRINEYLSHIITYHEDRLDLLGERENLREMRRIYRRKSVPRFECNECHMKFWDKLILQRHEKQVHEDKMEVIKIKPFKCPICQKGFRSRENLTLHLNLHSDNNPWVCDFPQCGRNFTRKYDLRRHKLLHVNSDKIREQNKCPICPATFTERNKITRHLRNVHKLTADSAVEKLNHYKPSVRSVTNYIKKVNSIAKTPPKSKDDVLPLPGSNIVRVKSEQEIHLTDKVLLTQDGDAIHLRGENLKPDPDQVTLSPKSESIVFLSPKLVKQEAIEDKSSIESDNSILFLEKNNQRDSFRCTICPATFSRAWTLNHHLTSVHNKTILEEVAPLEKDQVLLLCGSCAYPAKSKNDLEEHMKKFHSSAYKCKKCGINFNRRWALTQHVQKVHDQKRTHICKTCNKGFISPSHLRSHMKIHEGKKKCSICHRMLSAKSIDAHLKRHEIAQRKMKGEIIKTKYKCQLCKDYFASSVALQRHIDAIHLGKPINSWQQRLSIKKDWLIKTMEKMGFDPIELESEGVNRNLKTEKTEISVDNKCDDDDSQVILGF